MDVICKESSPQINKILVEYALEKGINVYPATKHEMGYPDSHWSHIVYDAHCNQIVRGSKNGDRKELSVGEFLTFIDKLAKPKIKIAGHGVEFSDHQVRVGCTNITHSEVKEFFKEYQERFGNIK